MIADGKGLRVLPRGANPYPDAIHIDVSAEPPKTAQEELSQLGKPRRQRPKRGASLFGGDGRR